MAEGEPGRDFFLRLASQLDEVVAFGVGSRDCRGYEHGLKLAAARDSAKQVFADMGDISSRFDRDVTYGRIRDLARKVCAIKVPLVSSGIGHVKLEVSKLGKVLLLEGYGPFASELGDVYRDVCISLYEAVSIRGLGDIAALQTRLSSAAEFFDAF